MSDIQGYVALVTGVAVALISGFFRRPEHKVSEASIALGAWKDIVDHLSNRVQEAEAAVAKCESHREEDRLWIEQLEVQIVELQNRVDNG